MFLTKQQYSIQDPSDNTCTWALEARSFSTLIFVTLNDHVSS